MQLQNTKAKFEQQGIRLAAISYDSQAILIDFAKRHNIEFPLLADPDSKVIRSFDTLNKEASGMNKGMAHPGFFYIDDSSIIREKYFEAKYTNRFTANNVIARLFPELTQEVSQSLQAPRLRLTLSQSDHTAVPGSRLSLIVDVELPPGVHVYSPTVKGYKPIQLVLYPSGGIEPAPSIYPNSKILYLQAIKENVPVFEGKFRITQDVTIPVSKVGAGVRALLGSANTVSIAGELKYQACDATICYPPTSVPLKWELKLEPLDLHRSPENIRHKDAGERP